MATITQYTITGGIPGQPWAELDLTIDDMRKTEIGKVRIKQAVLHPEIATAEVHGTYVATDCNVVAVMVAQLPLTAGKSDFGATIVAKEWGTPGTGWFWYTDTTGRHDIGPVAANPVEAAVMA